MTMKRCSENPILSAKDLSYPANLVFNAGVCKYQGRYVMVFRNDYGWGDEQPNTFVGTNIGVAYSEDGIHWVPQEKPWFEWKDAEVTRAYDPRITVVDGKVVLCFALDTHHGIRGGIAVTEDFDKWEVKSISAPENRNMVVFPEKINGKYARFERPFLASYMRQKHDLWYAESPDLVHWGNNQLVLTVEDVPFANEKVGPAAPPIKTSRGWLATFHGVEFDGTREKHGWEATWKKRYYAGLMLMDLNEPWKVIGMSRKPLLSPEAPYETQEGFRQDVIFPGGMLLEDTGEVKLYYGASDTVECLATAHVDDLLALIEPYTRG